MIGMIASLLLPFLASRPRSGIVVAIGGTVTDNILKQFVVSCKYGQILIIPTASERIEAGYDIQNRLYNSEVLHINTREDANRKDIANTIMKAKGIFFTGGDQSRLADVLLGTRAEKAILKAFRSGTNVAGTSAGAAFLGNPMIVGGQTEPLIEKGLGLVPFIIDQHYSERDRQSRLKEAVSSTKTIGYGIDEKTALLIDADNNVSCFGKAECHSVNY